MKKVLIFLLIGAMVAVGLNCASMSKTEKGATIGAGAGAIIGGIIGHQTGNKTAGIIIGAAIGGMAGAYIGNYMDKQAQEIEQEVPDADVIVVNPQGEAVENPEKEQGQAIVVTFNSGTLFDVDSYALKPGAKANLDKLAAIMVDYDQTDINIGGHTDSSGADEYNLKLSKQRAQTVADYIAEKGVSRARFTIKGYGESMPVASNDTTEGKQLNRRVEIIISANDSLKKDAQNKQG